MHVRKGDQVVVIAGKEKGKRGRVLRLLTEKGRVVIERINMVKRHTKPTQRNPRGGILEKEGSVEAVERGALVRQVRGARAARRSTSTTKVSKKRRVCVKCGTAVRDRVEIGGFRNGSRRRRRRRPTRQSRQARADARAGGGGGRQEGGARRGQGQGRRRCRQGQGRPRAAKEVATERVKRDAAGAPAQALRHRGPAEADARSSASRTRWRRRG